METGNAAALISVLPGAAVQELPGVELPRADGGAIVPVVLPVIGPTMVTGMAVAKVSGRPVLIMDGVDPGMPVMLPIVLIAVGLMGVLVFVEVTLMTEGESSTSVGEQLMLVPGSVGSCANGGEAKVVAGAPGTVAAEKRLENGLGPARAEETIAPGVVGIPMAVVPMVETCAKQLLPLSTSAAVAQRSARIGGSDVGWQLQQEVSGEIGGLNSRSADNRLRGSWSNAPIRHASCHVIGAQSSRERRSALRVAAALRMPVRASA
ncbi:hypothetical protein [Bradyrhizobium sp. 6(2017)]|uniref:hypothetical protein n=1 Tax=Bradyrhizobium sp. 6(2017) TaxID=1197460 RepID=UPI0013E1B335|nr:hypothetical protein [Bradyrhizobium sp. 6(2017)]QIG98244.1 hypothetical protein G6P99_42705 [Bradyrhizobium sp. 6(2017)]